jgi:spore coat polysaccharide biosynthesis predicted glycosyltransferase SpsG
VSELADEMAACDLLVCAAGTSVLEACCVGVPALLVPIADNQLAVAAKALELGLADSVGPAPGEGALGRKAEALLEDRVRSAAMVQRQHELVDGNGAARVATALLTLECRA